MLALECGSFAYVAQGCRQVEVRQDNFGDAPEGRKSEAISKNFFMGRLLNIRIAIAVRHCLTFAGQLIEVHQKVSVAYCFDVVQGIEKPRR